MKINVLLTSISRKVWLAKAFKNAVKAHGDGRVITADIDPLSAGLYGTDAHYIVPRASDPSFLPYLTDLCSRENIRLIVPTRDGELPVFASHKAALARIGVKVMVSDPAVIDTCNDKYRFYQFLIEHSIPSPRTYLPAEIDPAAMPYPLIIKSRGGSGGKGVFKVENERQLRFFLDYVADPIVQEFISGKEYTIDLFSDFSGNVLSVVPRERLETVCGESYKGITVEDPEIIMACRKLAETLGTIGHVTIQCIRGPDGIRFIEINPRYGGGAALGIASGADTPLMLVRLAAGEKVPPCIGDYRRDLVMLRYTQDIYMARDQVAHD